MGQAAVSGDVRGIGGIAGIEDIELVDRLVAARFGVGGVQHTVEDGAGVVTDDDLLAVQVEVEVLARRLAAAQLDIQAQIERRGLHRRDGHRSARAQARHVLRLSGAEAGRRALAVRALRHLPEVRRALAQGRIGMDQAGVIAQLWANPRIRDLVPGREAKLLAWAEEDPFHEFQLKAREWGRMVDLDGAFNDNERNHANRDVKLVQDGIDRSWDLSGHFGADQGARMREILDRHVEAEWQADWAEARARLGPSATAADLRRTDRQRRADALERIFNDAAGAPPGTRAPTTVHNIVWSAETYFGLLAHLGLDPEAPAGARYGASGREWCDPDTYRCSTLDGTPLDPVEALASSLAGHVRRVVVSSRGVVIDLGHSSRLFTGSARLAAQLQHPHCIWPGCTTPTSACEIDHLRPHTDGGATNPANGAPLCGAHNRWKQKGYATNRDRSGRWRTYRPDGTIIR